MTASIVLTSSSGKVREVAPSANRIEGLEEVRSYINGLDFGPLKEGLQNLKKASERPLSPEPSLSALGETSRFVGLA